MVTKLALIVVVFWAVLVGLFIAESGIFPSSARGWAFLIVFGPPAYVVVQALAELGLKRLDSRTKQLGAGSFGRIALLVLLVAPLFALAVYLMNR